MGWKRYLRPGRMMTMNVLGLQDNPRRPPAKRPIERLLIRSSGIARDAVQKLRNPVMISITIPAPPPEQVPT
jgi:hypothetical protein